MSVNIWLRSFISINILYEILVLNKIEWDDIILYLKKILLLIIKCPLKSIHIIGIIPEHYNVQTMVLYC